LDSKTLSNASSGATARSKVGLAACRAAASSRRLVLCEPPDTPTRRFIPALFVLLVVLTFSGCAQSPPEPDIPLTGPEAGRKLYVAKCAKCHKLYDPAKYSDAEWSKWMGKMTKKAKLTPEQTALLATYVDENLRHTDGDAQDKQK